MAHIPVYTCGSHLKYVSFRDSQVQALLLFSSALMIDFYHDNKNVNCHSVRILAQEYGCTLVVYVQSPIATPQARPLRKQTQLNMSV